jgi:DeoR/GlpR family transcriptional regulator of sugar metabolism
VKKSRIKHSFDERKVHILNRLKEKNTVKVSILANELKTSEITIRRDLEKLDQEGLLTKTFGGAKLRDFSLNEFNQTKRINEMGSEKKRIGDYAAGLVESGDVIFINTGSTCYYVSKALKNKKNITVITNSILVLTELRFNTNLQLILLGGSYDPISFSINGPVAENNIKNFRAKFAFVGTDGITLPYGATANSIHASQLIKSMIASTEKSILVGDHTKIGKIGPFKYADLNEFDLFITDKNISENDFNNIQSSGLKIKKV